MLLVDHLFVLLLFVVQPISGAIAYRRYLRKIKAGEPENRVKLYLQTFTLEWLAFAVLVTPGSMSAVPSRHWASSRRMARLFGLAPPCLCWSAAFSFIPCKPQEK